MYELFSTEKNPRNKGNVLKVLNFVNTKISNQLDSEDFYIKFKFFMWIDVHLRLLNFKTLND